MVFIYVLKLENDKYYIGKTKNHIQRVEEHFNMNGSMWTKENKPLEVVYVFEGDDYDEDKYVKKYMSEFGIDNVRGGSYSKKEITFQERKIIENEIKGATDKCFRCGRSSHFAKDCYAKKDASGKYINLNQNNSKDNQHDKQDNHHRKMRRPCVSCGGDHKIIDCHDPRNICYRCGRDDHWKIRCTEDFDINGYELKFDIVSKIGSFLFSVF